MPQYAPSHERSENIKNLWAFCYLPSPSDLCWLDQDELLIESPDKSVVDPTTFLSIGSLLFKEEPTLGLHVYEFAVQSIYSIYSKIHFMNLSRFEFITFLSFEYQIPFRDQTKELPRH